MSEFDSNIENTEAFIRRIAADEAVPQTYRDEAVEALSKLAEARQAIAAGDADATASRAYLAGVMMTTCYQDALLRLVNQGGAQQLLEEQWTVLKRGLKDRRDKPAAGGASGVARGATSRDRRDEISRLLEGRRKGSFPSRSALANWIIRQFAKREDLPAAVRYKIPESKTPWGARTIRDDLRKLNEP